MASRKATRLCQLAPARRNAYELRAYGMQSAWPVRIRLGSDRLLALEIAFHDMPYSRAIEDRFSPRLTLCILLQLAMLDPLACPEARRAGIEGLARLCQELPSAAFVAGDERLGAIPAAWGQRATSPRRQGFSPPANAGRRSLLGSLPPLSSERNRE